MIIPENLQKDSLALCSRTSLGRGPDCQRLGGVTEGGAALLPLLKERDSEADGVDLTITSVGSDGRPDFERELVVGRIEQSLLDEANSKGGGVLVGLSDSLATASTFDELREALQESEAPHIHTGLPG